MPDANNPFPLPDPAWPPAAPFWDGAARGELVLPRCRACDQIWWYPTGPACRRCGAPDPSVSWGPVPDHGTLYSWTVARRPLIEQYTDVPFTAGLVSLDIDPVVRVVTRIVDAEPDSLRIGAPVRAVYRPLRFPRVDGAVIAPLFTPT